VTSIELWSWQEQSSPASWDSQIPVKQCFQALF